MFKLNIETKGLHGYENEGKRWYKYQMLGNALDNAMSLMQYRMELMGATFKEITSAIDAVWNIKEDFGDYESASVRWERAGKSVTITIKNA